MFVQSQKSEMKSEDEAARHTKKSSDIHKRVKWDIYFKRRENNNEKKMTMKKKMKKLYLIS